MSGSRGAGGGRWVGWARSSLRCGVKGKPGHGRRCCHRDARLVAWRLGDHGDVLGRVAQVVAVGTRCAGAIASDKPAADRSLRSIPPVPPPERHQVRWTRKDDTAPFNPVGLTESRLAPAVPRATARRRSPRQFHVERHSARSHNCRPTRRLARGILRNRPSSGPRLPEVEPQRGSALPKWGPELRTAGASGGPRRASGSDRGTVPRARSRRGAGSTRPAPPDRARAPPAPRRASGPQSVPSRAVLTP